MPYEEQSVLRCPALEHQLTFRNGSDSIFICLEGILMRTNGLFLLILVSHKHQNKNTKLFWGFQQWEKRQAMMVIHVRVYIAGTRRAKLITERKCMVIVVYYCHYAQHSSSINNMKRWSTLIVTAPPSQSFRWKMILRSHYIFIKNTWAQICCMLLEMELYILLRTI